jgi:hypothetical protein
MKRDTYITAPESILTRDFIHPCHQFSCPHVYALVARQRLGKKENLNIPATQMLSMNVTAAKDTHTTMEELLDASFSMRAVSNQGK